MIRHLSHDFTQYAVEPGAFEMRRAQFYEWILIELLHNTCTLCSLHTKPVLGRLAEVPRSTFHTEKCRIDLNILVFIRHIA